MENNSADSPNKRKLNTGYLPSGDVVKTNLVEAGATREQIDAALWLLTYGREHKLGQISALAKKLNVSTTTLSRVFAGKYGAELTNITETIVHFRKLDAERKHFGEIPIVKNLRVVKDISAFCELTRVSGTMSVLHGPNQSGKSWALKKVYQPANNHGRTIYLDLLPSGGTTRMALEDLLTECGISSRKSYGDMRRSVFRYFDPQTLLIMDEFHQTMLGRTLKLATIELPRAIYEQSGAPVVLCGTDVVNEMFEDSKFSKFLGQIGNRGVLRRLIPATPYPEDVGAICQAYGLECEIEPETEKRAARVTYADEKGGEKVEAIANTNGIGKLCKFFQMSRRLANKKGVAFGWEHFLTTHATITSWAKGERMLQEGGAR